MCDFIQETYVMPGWGCCECRTYNGLQRINCKICGRSSCGVDVPSSVNRCDNCGFGFTIEKIEICPSCNLPICLIDKRALTSHLN